MPPVNPTGTIVKLTTPWSKPQNTGKMGFVQIWTNGASNLEWSGAIE